MTSKRTIIFGLLAVSIFIYALVFVVELKRVSVVQKRSIAAHVSELDRQIEQLSYIPKLLSADSTIVGAIESGTDKDISLANLRLQMAQKESGLDFAFLMNSDGVTIASSNWDNSVSFVGNDYSFRPYFKGAIRGSTSTYFAVGATTGIPGYFIAEPVTAGSKVMGVVVAKMALTAPLDTWKEFESETAVLDEYGVIILATKDSLLYRSTRALSADEIVKIQRERRYPIEHLDTDRASKQLTQYRKHTSNLRSEPWSYITLVSRTSYHRMATYITAALFSVVCIGLLLTRIYRQQRHLVAFEQRHSKELEEQVMLRTEELETAQAALIAESNYAILGRMSAAINHEINQPLASLRLNLASLRKLIENPSGNVSEIEDIVVESDRTTKRIGLVISTLRNYTRRNRMDIEAIDVSALIKDVIDAVNTERPAMSRHIVVEASKNTAFIEGDRILLQQALLNILYNAIDAVIQLSEPIVKLKVAEPIRGSDIRASADNERSGDVDANQYFVSISVIDNGEGVPPEFLSRLFEPFSTAKDNQGGLGLGLTIANQIAESHRGKLIYTRVLEGSMFSLMLPVVK